MRAELTRIPGGLRTRRFAGHLDVAAQRQRADAVVRVAVLDAEQARAEAQRKDLNANAAKLGDSEVAELVH
jgi:hypothetical protein